MQSSAKKVRRGGVGIYDEGSRVDEGGGGRREELASQRHHNIDRCI